MEKYLTPRKVRVSEWVHGCQGQKIEKTSYVFLEPSDKNIRIAKAKVEDLWQTFKNNTVFLLISDI